MKVLVVDDEEIIRTTVAEILKGSGDHEIDFAQDGEEALKKSRVNFYDLLLLDIRIPKIDGYEVLKKVRLMYPDLPVIFLTGKGDVKKIMESIAQYKLNGMIEKPFTPEQVLAIVKKYLKK